MEAALLGCRLFLAGVFGLAGASKLADLAGPRQAVMDFGMPERFAPVAGVFLPVAELAVAVALVPLFSARFGALGAGLLLVCFGAAIANGLAHGRAPDCHCFGQVHSAPVGWRTLGRNLLLLGVAGFVAVAGWRRAGDSATRWVTEVGAGWLVAIAAGLVVIALICFQVWFAMQRLSRNGRTLERLEAPEAALEGMIGAFGLAENGAHVDPALLGHGLQGAGLAVGSPAPAFELESLDGQRDSLDLLLTAGRRLMLVFWAAGCGPCDALMPDVARWQRDHARLLNIAVVASGLRQAAFAVATEHGLKRVLLQLESEVADAYQAHGTPMAVVIGPDGRIASPTVGGPEAITTLVAQATRPALAIRQHVPSANGNGNGAAPRPSPPPEAGSTEGVGR